MKHSKLINVHAMALASAIGLLGVAQAVATTIIDGTLIVEPQTNVMTGAVLRGTYDDPNVSQPPALNGGTRLMWYPRKSALRAGTVTGTQWNDLLGNPIGAYSSAFGYNAQARGMYSFSVGNSSLAHSTGGVAMGGSTAIGDYAVAIGASYVSGSSSVALGASYSVGLANFSLGENLITGNENLVLGINNDVGDPNNTNVVIGYNNAYYTQDSFAFGSGNYSENAPHSFAIGSNNSTWTSQAMVVGRGLIGSVNQSLIVGYHNSVIQGSGQSWIGSDPLFVIGNGSTTQARSNAMVIRKNGNTKINGDFEATGLTSIKVPAQGGILMGEFGTQ
jgi:hypothetical protein